MGIMCQTFNPSQRFVAKARYLLQKWNELTNEKRESIIKEVLDENSRTGQRNEALAKAINSASTDHL
jgi:glutaminase